MGCRWVNAVLINCWLARTCRHFLHGTADSVAAVFASFQASAGASYICICSEQDLTAGTFSCYSMVLSRLLCLLLQEIKAHPFFEGVDWQNLHTQSAPYVPRVDHELDTQNFERFDEDMAMASPGALLAAVIC